jgi:ribosome-binding factor A
MKLERRKKAEAIAKKLVSEYLIREHPELSEEFGLVTVTGIELSSELSYIDIYVSALRNKE